MEVLVAGRTARAGKGGLAVSLADHGDARIIRSWASQLDVAFEAAEDVGALGELA